MVESKLNRRHRALLREIMRYAHFAAWGIVLSIAVLSLIIPNLAIAETPKAGANGPNNRAATIVHADSWRVKEEKALHEIRQFLRDDEKITLSVSCIEAADSDTAFLGGSYSDGAGSYRSALLASHDGGKTWQDTSAWLASSRVCAIRVLDKDHVWCLVCWSIEGDQAPYYVLSSSDSGKTWKCSNLLTGDMPTSLSSPFVFSFTDPRNGLLIFRSSLDDIGNYVTTDGGVTWQLAAKFKANPDHLWPLGRTLDMLEVGPYQYEYKANSDEKNGVIRILRRDESSAPWRLVARIPLRYRLKGIELLPLLSPH